MVHLINITKKFDIKYILKNLNFTILEGQKIAIIGQNGQGKSTLMNIITKQIEPDTGEVIIDGSKQIEMLSQNPIFDKNMTVIETIENQLDEINIAIKRHEELSQMLENDFENKTLLDEHSDITNFLDHKNGWDISNQINRILYEFKLQELKDKNINTLSGGEQKRVLLSGLILKKPDLLLLDEPTNHLDVYMVEFLEQILNKQNTTLLFISHDRYFIDNVATNVVEIDDGVLRKFDGGYGDYLIQKEQLLSNMQKEQNQLQKKLVQEASWMQKGVAARRKRNERRKAQYLELKEFLKTNPSKINKIKIELQREQKSFNSTQNISKRKVLFELKNISKSINDKKLIENFSTRILQKDSIAVVGPNGCGKSTLLKILLEKESIDSGEIYRGEFKVGYFDQQRDMLKDDETILETFCPNGGDMVQLNDGRTIHTYGYLKNFLFPKEYLDKKIGVLSGGEKNRVALALLFTKKVDLLILDEPTNDLDIPTINILEEYLSSFMGALIFVSHDRYFVDKIAKKLFVWTDDGKLMESYQPYSEYLSLEKQLKDIKRFSDNIPKKLPVISKIAKPKTKLTYNEQRELENLPDEINELETILEELKRCMQDAKCHEKKGLVKLSLEFEEKDKIYNQKVDRFLELEILKDSFEKLP